MQNGALVKTKRFGEPKYVGDPLNAVRIFNEKEVDELIVVDIDATNRQQPPDEQLIRQLASESRMPLCYGGGVKTVGQIESLISLGVEKVALSSAAILNPAIVEQAAQRLGSQSIVCVVDVKWYADTASYKVMLKNGTQNTGLDPLVLCKQLAELGTGEIVINSIDNDGMMTGYDLGLVSKVHANIGVPITTLGGAGSLSHLIEAQLACPLIGLAAGSMFVFKGKFRAVMINYPSYEERVRNGLLD